MDSIRHKPLFRRHHSCVGFATSTASQLGLGRPDFGKRCQRPFHLWLDSGVNHDIRVYIDTGNNDWRYARDWAYLRRFAEPGFTVGSTNGLTLNGTTTVNLSNAGVQSAGEIPLIAYIGNPIASGLVLGSLPGPRVAAAIDYSTSGLIQINVTSTGAIKWTGVVNSTWDTGTVINQVGNGTFNWQINASATNFVTNDAVIFDDTANGAGAVAVTIPLAVSPTSATFANTNRAYTIAGAAIAGAGPVVVSGGGTVTLATPNTYSGGTFLMPAN